MDATGWRWSNTLTAYGLLSAKPGQKIYVASSAENRTYRATVKPDGTLGDLTRFVERGGESVAWDAEGHVYVANGEVFVYDGSGNAIGRIDVPERPIQILFGGADRHTLFVLTHHTLYAVKTRVAGARPN
jgi:sugar lactone lactonase YvrE